MAINPNTTYPGQVEAPDANYPLGGAKNETAPSAFDGTPFEKAMANDIFGFQQFLLTEAGLTASNNSETALVSQYAEAIKILNIEVGAALRSARLKFNAVDTVDISFTYVFADGTTWADITGVSTTTTGKTNGDIYWLGVFVDGSKIYTPSSPPLAADIFTAWSAANNVVPAQPTNGVKLGTLLRGVGDAGGDADITRFEQFGKAYYNDNTLGVTMNLDNTITQFSLADEISPVAVKLYGDNQFSLTTANGARITSTFFSAFTGGVLLDLRANAGISHLGEVETFQYCELNIQSPQAIRNKGVGNDSGGVQDLTANILRIAGYTEE